MSREPEPPNIRDVIGKLSNEDLVSRIARARSLLAPPPVEREPDIVVEVGFKELLTLASTRGFLGRQNEAEIERIRNNIAAEQAAGHFEEHPMDVLFVEKDNLIEAGAFQFRPDMVREIRKAQQRLTVPQINEYFDQHPLELLRIDPIASGVADSGFVGASKTTSSVSEEVRQALRQKADALTSEQIFQGLDVDPLQVLTFHNIWLGGLPYWGAKILNGPKLYPIGEDIEKVIGKLTAEEVKDFLVSQPTEIFKTGIVARNYLSEHSYLSPEARAVFGLFISRLRITPANMPDGQTPPVTDSETQTATPGTVSALTADAEKLLHEIDAGDTIPSRGDIIGIALDNGITLAETRGKSADEIITLLRAKQASSQ